MKVSTHFRWNIGGRAVGAVKRNGFSTVTVQLREHATERGLISKQTEVSRLFSESFRSCVPLACLWDENSILFRLPTAHIDVVSQFVETGVKEELGHVEHGFRE